MLFRWLAVAVACVHAGYLVYVVVGGFVAWRFPKTFFVHLIASGWAALIVAFRIPCPLTTVQNALRVRAGQLELPGAFLDVYVRGVVYPVAYEDLVWSLVAALVAFSWIVLAVRYRAARVR